MKLKRVKNKVWMFGMCFLLALLIIPSTQIQAASKKKVTSIKITNVYNGKLTLERGKTYSLKTSISPSNASNKALTWKSSNSKVVQVSSKGKLKAVKTGTAKITATAKDGSKKKATIAVTVGKRVTKVDIKNSATTLLKGKTLNLKTSVYPSNASNKTIRYTSSNTKVATVSSKGVVKAVGVPAGKTSATATITATSLDGSAKKDAVKITVRVPVSSVKITNVTNGKLTLEKGKTYTLKTSVSPSNAANKALTWKSSNSKVVKVTSTGKLTAVKNGTAKITVTAKDGSKKSASITVTVGKRVSSLSIKNGNQTLLKGKSLQLQTVVGPSNASNKGLIYESSNTKIATVSSKGVVKAVGVPSGKTYGSATITVRSVDGSNKKASIKITVKQPVSSIAVKEKTIVLDKAETYKPSVTIAPTNAYTKSLKYSSSNTKVATVSNTGEVRTVGYGTSKIRMMSADGSNVASEYTVIVTDDVQSITVPKTTQQLIVGETLTIEPTATPAAAAGNGFTFTTSNAKVITVTTAGKVTAKGTGKAYVTVKAKDATGVTAKVNFEVKTYEQVKLSGKQFVSHMGLNKEAPSNSMPAFVKAGESASFMGIETDVRETKDGEFVGYHDDNINTRTNKSGLISSLTLEQVLSAKMTKGSNISLYTNLQIPTLKEYLYTCKVYNKKPVLHIKNVRNYKNLLNLLKEVGVYENTIITGSKATMEKIRAIDKKVNLYWLCNMTKNGIDWATANNIHINTDYSYVTQELVEYAHSKKRVVGAWTVNNSNTVRKLLNKGVDFITTDYDYVK